MKPTRRELAALLSTTAIAAAAPQAQPHPSTPPEELQAARERLQAAAAQLAQLPLPMATEPAFQFKA